MKSCSCPLRAHLAQEVTTLAYLWKVRRVDGLVLGFTTHDQDIVYDDGLDPSSPPLGAVTYQASTGFTNTAVAGSSDLSVDNMEVTGFLDSESILEDDLRNGLYDDAEITILLVNWADLTMGHVILRAGTLGMVKMKNGLFMAEIRGLAHKLTTALGATYGPICRATFGSGLNGIDMQSHYLCKFDVSTVRESGQVTAVIDNRTLDLTQSPPLTSTDGWFDDGFITFTSGALSGRSFETKSWDGAILGLFQSMPVLPEPGDAFVIEPGCNKTIDDCQNKFSNIVNFRGEPFIPGMDQLLDQPNAQ